MIHYSKCCSRSFETASVARFSIAVSRADKTGEETSYVSAFVFVDTCHFVAGQAVGVLRLVCEVLDCLVFYGKYTESPVHMPEIQ